MDRFIEANGIRMRYRIDGAGPDLVLVHGVGAQLESWDGVVARLGGRFRCIAYDLRGHGATDKPAGPYSIDGFAADLAGLMDALGVARCHLAGFSLGGLIGQRFALDYADRLDRLALLSAIAGRTEEERARVAARLEVVESGAPGDHFEKSLPRWFTDGYLRDNPDVIAEARAQNQRNDPQAYAAAYRVLATAEMIDELANIQAPTLVATGAGDLGSTPRMSRVMHERIAGSELHILADLRHSILTEAPDRVSALLADFLRPGGPRPLA